MVKLKWHEKDKQYAQNWSWMLPKYSHMGVVHVPHWTLERGITIEINSVRFYYLLHSQCIYIYSIHRIDKKYSFYFAISYFSASRSTRLEHRTAEATHKGYYWFSDLIVCNAMQFIHQIVEWSPENHSFVFWFLECLWTIQKCVSEVNWCGFISTLT